MKKGNRILGVKDDDFFNFVKKINELSEKNEVFATQPIIRINDPNFYALLHFKVSDNKEVVKSQPTPTTSENRGTFQPATKKQVDYLIGLGVNFPKDLTKQEASKLIEENKGTI